MKMPENKGEDRGVKVKQVVLLKKGPPFEKKSYDFFSKTTCFTFSGATNSEKEAS
ncbi:MAG: hypothetical protein K5896_07020 [Prevotella sp.]|nr:hypothetical protein [Prevotella sp.]